MQRSDLMIVTNCNQGNSNIWEIFFYWWHNERMKCSLNIWQTCAHLSQQILIVGQILANVKTMSQLFGKVREHKLVKILQCL